MVWLALTTSIWIQKGRLQPNQKNILRRIAPYKWRGPKPVSNFDDHAGPLTEMVLVGNLAARLGKNIKFPAKFDACDLRDVRKFIKRSYRAGWEPQLA
jgi:hypothetical protein